MKHFFLTTLLAFGFNHFVSAQSLPVPPPSPKQTVNQQFGTTSIEVIYSRPGLKGRKAFGDVVAYGKLWRTGANSATTIEFGENVTVNTTEVPKGKYGMVTIPNESEWEVIITKDLNVTGDYNFKKENVVARFPVKPEMLNDKVETFTIDISDIQPQSAEVVIKWDMTMVRFSVKEDIDAKIMAAIEKDMKNDKRPFHTAATYYFENGKDLKQALEWENKALEANPSAYWILTQKAKIQNALKDYPAAMATAQVAMEAAKKGDNDAYVKMNEALMAEINANPAYKK
jgi:hypothetical protein